MYRKKQLKVLIIVFCVLLILVVILKFSERNKGKSSFGKGIVKFDTAQVTSITIQPKDRLESEYSLIKQDNEWWVVTDNNRFRTDDWPITGILTELAKLQPENVVAQDETKWDEYEVTDSTGVVVEVTMGKRSSKFYIGKFSYQQPAQPSQGQVKIKTYIRYDGNKNVFQTEGFLQFVFNKTINEIRSKEIIPADVTSWSKISFTYADSSFYLHKQDGKWWIESTIVDSLIVNDYIKQIAGLRASDIVKTTNTSFTPSFSITLENNNKSLNNIIKAVVIDTLGSTHISSTYNKGTVFLDRNGTISEKLFVGRDKFMVATKK